ncbi:hypothetical protein Tco_0523631 [Tanacetum coccineum]
MSSLKEDTLFINSMMTEMYEVFKGQSSSAPSDSVTPTLALTHIPANVKGENATKTATKDPPSHTKGETDANKHEKPDETKHSTEANIELIGSSTHQPSITQAQPITIIHPEPIIPHREGKCITTDDQSKDQRKLVKALSIVRLDPDEPVKVEFIINGKIVHLIKQEIQDYWDKEEQIKKAKEEARLLAISKPKVIKVICEKAKKLVSIQKRQLPPKLVKCLRKLGMLNMQSSRENTLRSRLKSEPITDIKIHLKIKLVVITFYKGTDGRNFDVYKPFTFGEFGISKLDELREIIPKKKNTVVKDLMNSLARRGNTWNLILKRESLDWNAIELSLKMPRSSTTLSSKNLIDASMVKSFENARFNMKLRKLIAEHPDQEKLKSKKVKMEALGYKMDWALSELPSKCAARVYKKTLAFSEAVLSE